MKEKTFTLAEVLITLVIIGIIAAITVPVIMENHRKIETAARVKKFYSNISNMINLIKVDNGVEYLRYYGDTDYLTSENILKYHSYTKILPHTGNSLVLLLNDGSKLTTGFWSTIEFTIDTNGDKKPNKCGYDIFSVSLGENNSSNQISFNCFGNTREEVIEALKEGANYTDSACGQSDCYTNLLMMDGWEFKDDYPWNL